MNKTERKKEIKKELDFLDKRESILNQDLSLIAGRKQRLTAELEKLGASTQPQRGKKELSPEMTFELMSAFRCKGIEYR